MQNCAPARAATLQGFAKLKFWQPEVSTLQEFPRHCPGKAAKLQTWQSKSAKLQALVAKQTWQAFSSNSARLCKTATPTNLPKHCPSKGAKLQTWQGCKIANLQGSNTVGPAPTLQDFPSKSAKLQGPGKVAKLPTCKGSNTAGAKLQPLPTLPTCQSFNTAGFPLAARSAKLQIRLQNPTARLQHCRHTQLQGFSSLPSSLLNCRARLQTTTSC